MDGGAWWAAVHGVARSRTRLCDFTFTFHRKWQPTPVCLPGVGTSRVMHVSLKEDSMSKGTKARNSSVAVKFGLAGA